MKRRVLYFIIPVIIIILIIVLNYDNILIWRYNVAVENKNCEKIYEIVNIEDSKYLTKEKYVSQCKLNIENYDNYEVEVENHKVRNNIVKVYNNITFYIPSDSDFYLDDELISDANIYDENSIYNIFTFDKLFEGEYSVKFNSETNEENDMIIISQNDLEKTYEYNNEKQLVTVIGYDSCRFCTGLLSFLSTLDSNIFDVKYYDIYDKGANKDVERVKTEFYQHFNKEIDSYPTVVIGDKYLLGFNDELEKKYIESIYHSYRNEIETIIK